MTTNILDPSALMVALPSLLPGGNKTLNSPQDGIAALFHTALVALSFRFISLDEAISASGSDSNSVLPIDWNKHGPGYYSFKYKHDQSSLDFLLKVCKLGKRTVINAIALQVGNFLLTIGSNLKLCHRPINWLALMCQPKILHRCRSIP